MTEDRGEVQHLDEPRLERIREVAKALEDLPEDLRIPAFEMFTDYIRGEGGATQQSAAPTGEKIDESTTLETFFADKEIESPAEAVMACVAYWYSQYGNEPVGSEEVREIGEQVGLTLPTRIDMTLRGAKRAGRPLFRALGGGLFLPTVHGERVLKDEWAVSKGRQRRNSDGS